MFRSIKTFMGKLTRATNDSNENSINERTFIDVKIPAPWGHISGKWWGKLNCRPILCLHNLQETCDSFDRLIPTIETDVSFLVIDLPGHGYSSWLPQGAFYTDMLFLATVQHIVNYFGWDRVSLMGHLYGGTLAFLYNLMAPTACDFAIYLDAVYPDFRQTSPSAIHKEICKFLELGKIARKDASVGTLDEFARNAYTATGRSIEIKYVHFIMVRNLRPSVKSPGWFYPANDPRTRFTTSRSFDIEVCLNATKKIFFPSLLLKSAHSHYLANTDEYSQFRESLQFMEVSDMVGTEYNHINAPIPSARVIGKFLKKNLRSRERMGFKRTIKE